MCCIFTCLGWMIDLIQRFWTFAMSCCISSAVCCLLVIASMSGIALGYNYSLAEYVDLKESNVSIFLKRGIFDDEISDLQLRRAKEQGYMRSGSEGSGSDQSGRRSGNEESSTLKSGRRLDDSVFESGDQHKYEGSLMKLTAKPPYEHTTAVHITEDTDMQLAIGSYTKDSLDALKAVQSVIDARRAYAQTIRGPTLSPVPTIKEFALYNEDNMRRNMPPAQRRMMVDPNILTTLSPARAAVPNYDLAEAVNWVAPMKNVGQVISFKNYGLEHESTTFPSSIVLNTGGIRPTPTRKGLGLFLTKFTPITLFSTRPTYETGMTAFTQNPKELSFKEKLMAENDRPIRKHRPKSDEEYEYDIKGLPVRKRRSINLDELAISNDSYAIPYKYNKRITQTINIKVSKEPNDNIIKLNKTLELDLIAKNENLVTYKTDMIHNKIINVIAHSDEQNNNESTTETPLEQKINETIHKNLFTHIMTNFQRIKERLSELFLYDKLSVAPNENDNDDIPIRETLFINKIVSSEYNTNLNDTEDNLFKDGKTSVIHRNFSHVEDTSRPLLIVMTSYTAT